MTPREAQALTRVLHHLDGSVLLDEVDLFERDVAWLYNCACVATGVAIPLDEDALVTVLGEVAQRYADGGA